MFVFGALDDTRRSVFHYRDLHDSCAPLLLMNSVINHVAKVAIAAQPKVSGERKTHAAAEAA